MPIRSLRIINGFAVSPFGPTVLFLGRRAPRNSSEPPSKQWVDVGATPAAASRWRSIAGAAREIRGRAAARRRHVDRRPGPELARARRADGRARRSIPDAHRRNQVRRREDARRSARGDRIGAAGGGGRRARRLPVVEPAPAGADHPPHQPGDVDPSAGRIFAWVRVRGLEHLDASTVRSCSRRIIRAISTCR